jgi:signal transduction histidine kinase
MSNFLNFLFNTNYIPHGHCYLWQPRLVLLHAVSDAITALAYYSIPLLLIFFVQKRQDIPFKKTFFLFSAFIISCGTNHIIDVWTLWHPMYWLSGFAKAITASVSLFTALEMVSLIPKALSLPSPAQLEATNRELRNSQAQLQLALDFEALLKRITDKVRDSLDENQILRTVVEELGKGLGVSACNAAIYNLEAQTSTICYEYTNFLVSSEGQVMEMSELPTVYQQLFQGDIFQFCLTEPDPVRGKVALLACPIRDDQTILGNLWLINDKDFGFRDLDLRVVQQVANQCAIALRQARLYQTAQAQVQELERLNHLKDDFLSTVSHELRTPISNIRIAAHMLEIVVAEEGMAKGDGEPAVEQHHNLSMQRADRYFQILKTECQREAQLINDLLDLSRLDAKTEPLEFTEVTLLDWLPALAEPFTDRIDSHNQQLKFCIPSDLPTLTTDVSVLTRILAELINNACKYTPAGETITIAVDLAEPSNPSSHPALSISVSNSGVEIPEGEGDRVFEKFYRIPKNDPWKHGGTGLGLALVKKLVERLDAAIRLESANNQVTFVIELPIKTVNYSVNAG